MKLRFFAAIAFSLLVSACGSTSSVDTASKGGFKVGKPYQVQGQWYHPKESYQFSETGIASWYGPQFHGKPTANGEKFDMHELTAAHRTLQMPSLVRVTNLDNGRSVIVRINDRGPFKRGRVIDVSMKAADLLGFKNQGTAKVRLDVLDQESRAIAEAAKRGQDVRGIELAMNENTQAAMAQLGTSSSYQQASLSAPPSGAQTALQANTLYSQPSSGAVVPGHVKNGNFMPDPVVAQMPVTSTNIYIQAGSFSSQENAMRLASALQSQSTPAQVFPALVNGRNFYRVRLGPVMNVDAADALLAKVIQGGNANAIIVVD